MSKSKIFISALISIFCLLQPITLRADKYYDRKVSLFDILPIKNTDIVFLGNSITDGGEFHELLNMTNVKNRGISSDVINGVLKRLPQVTNGKPQKIFLLIGINDVSHKLTVDQLAKRYETLVKEIRKQSPETELYVQSVMPINNDFKQYKSLIGTESTIKSFNARIKKIAEENKAIYIDLTPALADPKTGKLKRNYTNDGLHLSGQGYKAWINVLRPYITKSSSK